MSAVSVPDVVRELVNEFEAIGETPQSINNGYCGSFSDQLMERLVDLGELRAIPCDAGDLGVDVDEGAHIWTWLDGRHYDSEVPEGVEDWTLLPFFQRHPVRRREPIETENGRLRAGSQVFESVRKRLLAKEPSA